MTGQAGQGQAAEELIPAGGEGDSESVKTFPLDAHTGRYPPHHWPALRGETFSVGRRSEASRPSSPLVPNLGYNYTFEMASVA